MTGVQTCALPICNIPSGSLFYGENRRRTSVEFTEGLRAQVMAMLDEMHDLWKKGYTPRVKAKKGCSACSLKDICIPGLGKVESVESYISSRISGE